MSTPCFASVIISCAFASEIFMSFCIFFTSRSCRKGALASAVFARHACAATSRYASSGGISNSLTSMSIFLCISGSCWWIACSSMCFELARGRYFPLQPMELCCCCCEVGPSDLERVATMGRAGAGIDVALGRSPNDTTGFLSAHLWSRSVGSRSISRRRRSALCSSLTRSVPRCRTQQGGREKDAMIACAQAGLKQDAQGRVDASCSSRTHLRQCGVGGRQATLLCLWPCAACAAHPETLAASALV
mmetsp:Transcript_29679/g.72884  ORF Transcript_29679/g.72884 Transcript_29679/m.72884 type:complete len:247 (-) Transcript_29679:2871-3611(-)